jgi:hypothetical protein
MTLRLNKSDVKNAGNTAARACVGILAAYRQRDRVGYDYPLHDYLLKECDENTEIAQWVHVKHQKEWDKKLAAQEKAFDDLIAGKLDLEDERKVWQSWAGIVLDLVG